MSDDGVLLGGASVHHVDLVARATTRSTRPAGEEVRRDGFGDSAKLLHDPAEPGIDRPALPSSSSKVAEHLSIVSARTLWQRGSSLSIPKAMILGADLDSA